MELEFVNVDYDRVQRCGVPEVIYGAGKSTEQIVAIIQKMLVRQHNAFVTRVAPDQATAILRELPQARYHATARALTCDLAPLPTPVGSVAILCAGTSDLPVAEEAALTAERLGAALTRVYDVGVAGLHRLLSQRALFANANVIIVVAGMEGALPSVVGGLVDKPLIAVPTSVGYGSSFQGLTALLGMLNSCTAGVTVVNIDNGFGAGVAAARINRLIVKAQDN